MKKKKISLSLASNASEKTMTATQVKTVPFPQKSRDYVPAIYST
jgi:hypothetical protein